MSTIRRMLLCSLSMALTHASSFRLVYQYDHPVWIENMAVRPNGWILPATATSAVLTQLNPATGEQQVVHDWSAEGNAIMSITDVVPDIFLANTMMCDMTMLECTPGSGITWLVDLRNVENCNDAYVKELARGPDARSLLNGAAALNDEIVLMVDQALGGIWGVNIVKDTIELLFTDESMTDPTSSGGGVNGIRVVGDTLYFNNPSIGTFSRIAIDPITGAKAGVATVIRSGLSPDDFEIDAKQQVAYLTNGSEDELLRIELASGAERIVVNGLPGPTTARWVNKDDHSEGLYIATTGGYDQWLSGNATVGGAFYKYVM